MAESGQQSAFISIYHKRVPVTAEMKIELHRMNSTLRAKMRKERRCAQKTFAMLRRLPFLLLAQKWYLCES